MSEYTLEREVVERLVKIESKIDGLIKAKEVTYNNENEVLLLKDHQKDMEERLTSLEDSNKWIMRTVIAAIITSAVGIVFALIKTGAGI